MQGTMTGKILSEHLVSGRLEAGEEVGLRIDQTLLQDATGTMACMEFEALGLDRVRVDLAVQYVDHNMLGFDHRNADDHLFLQGCAARYGLWYSRAGNGICHQVHTERFARPGATLLGADSHTPTSGACGSIAIGAGGLEVALAMAGHPFQTPTPIVVGVRLEGELPPWVASKDLILWLIREYTVKGGLNRIFEFTGPGVATLPVTQRATVCNMITELGGTTAIFPSDEQTRRFLARQRREDQWVELGPDEDASYDEEVHVDLGSLEPLIAKPHQPDNVVPVEEVAGTPVFQVCFGSSVNSWYEDLAIPAAVLAGEHLPPTTVGTVSPGSRQILTTITTSGCWRAWSGPACASWSRHVGRASASASPADRQGQRPHLQPQLQGPFGHGRRPGLPGLPGDHGGHRAARPDHRPPHPRRPAAGRRPRPGGRRLHAAGAPAARGGAGRDHPRPQHQGAADPAAAARGVHRPGPDRPGRQHLHRVDGSRRGDRHGRPVQRAAIAEYTFMKEDAGFVRRAKDWQGGFIVGGDNYGQGSSREHAALALSPSGSAASWPRASPASTGAT